MAEQFGRTVQPNGLIIPKMLYHPQNEHPERPMDRTPLFHTIHKLKMAKAFGQKQAEELLGKDFDMGDLANFLMGSEDIRSWAFGLRRSGFRVWRFVFVVLRLAFSIRRSIVFHLSFNCFV